MNKINIAKIFELYDDLKNAMSDENTDDYIKKEIDFLKSVQDFLKSDNIKKIYQSNQIKQLKNEDILSLKYFIAKSLSVIFNKDQSFSYTTYVSACYWNDDDKELPLYCNDNKKNKSFEIRNMLSHSVSSMLKKNEVDDLILRFSDPISSDIFTNILKNQITEYSNFDENVDDEILKEASFFTSETKSWFQSIVIPVTIESKNYKYLTSLNSEIINQSANEDIEKFFPYGIRLGLTEMCNIVNIKEAIEKNKFYFWAESILSMSAGSEDFFDSRESSIHVIKNESGKIAKFHLTIEILKNGKIVGTMNAKKNVYYDEELYEVMELWADKKSVIDAVSFTFGEEDELDLNEISQNYYHSIVVLPDGVTIN